MTSERETPVQEGSTILIIDDEPVARDALSGLLMTEGYRLEMAADGPAGLARAATLHPDLILLDVMMPEMDGYEVCRRLRADPALRDVPVVMVTALDDAESRVQGLETGADDFVSKPFNRIELRARVRTVMRLNRYRRLLSERQRFQWIVDQSGDGYLVLNRAPEHDAIVYANPRARMLLQLSEEDLTRPDRSLDFRAVAQRTYQLVPASAWSAWDSLHAAEHVYTLVRPETENAPVFWLEARVFDGEADGTRTVCLADVSRRMSDSLDLRRFQCALSHKLRTPASQLISSLELLSLSADEISSPEMVEMVYIAHQGASRLSGELTEILNYLELRVRPQPSEQLSLAETVERITEAARAVGVRRIDIAVPNELADAPIPLSTRAVDLIAWEVADNSIKFHPARNPALQIAAQQNHRHDIALSIADNGSHVAADQIEQVWQPFIQGEKFATGEMPGMGLGLPSVAALIWQAGGAVELANRSDSPGVRVTMTFPAR